MRYLPRGVSYRRNPDGAIPRPVFGIDIDGTMGDYHRHFLRFAAGWVGVKDWPGPKAAREHGIRYPHDMYDGTCSLAEYMGVSKATYRRIKLAYRQGGLKRSMPAFAGASALTRGLRHRGAEVWVCTTRPFLQHERIEPDTREWLRRNRIQYDGVLSGEHKYRDLVKTVGAERVVAVLDDLPEMLLQAERLGITAVMMSAPHNDWTSWAEGDRTWTGWYSLDAATPNPPLTTLLTLLEKWEAEKGLTSSPRTRTSEPAGT